jgi:hypothetical protein
LAAISRVCLSLHHSASISLPRPCGAHPSLFQGAPCGMISFYLCAYHQIGCLLFALYPTALDLGCRRDTHSFYSKSNRATYFLDSARGLSCILDDVVAYLHSVHLGKRSGLYCTISTKCSSKLCNFSSEKAEIFPFSELRRFLHTSKNLGCHASLNTGSK